MTSAEQIMVKLGLDNASLKAGMASTTEYLKGVAGHIGGLVTGFIGLEGAMEIKRFAQEAGEFAHELLEQSKNLQVSVEWLQKYNSEAIRAGLDGEQAAKSIRKFNEQIGEARTGSEEAVKKFQKWNITLDDANGRHKTTQELIGEVVNRINQIPDASERAAAKLDMLGKQGEKTFEALANLKTHRFEDTFQLTERETEALSGYKSSGTFFKNMGLKALAKITEFTPFGALGQQQASREKIAAESPELTAFNEAEKKQKTIQEALAKVAEMQRQANIKNLAPAERFNELLKDRERIYASLRGMDVTSKEYLQANKDLLEKDLEIHKAMADTEKQRVENQKAHNDLLRHRYDLMQKLLGQIAPGTTLDKMVIGPDGKPTFLQSKTPGKINQSDIDRLTSDEEKLERAKANFRRYGNDTTRGALIEAGMAVDADKKRITDALDKKNEKPPDAFQQAAHNAVQKFLRDVIYVRFPDEE